MAKAYLKESQTGSGRFVEYNEFQVGSLKFSLKTGRSYKRYTPTNGFPGFGTFYYDWNGADKEETILLARSETKWYSKFFDSIL